MLDAIQQAFQASDYDFLVTANPDDPRRSNFPAWVDYYRLKWAIAWILPPRSILEIGSRRSLDRSRAIVRPLRRQLGRTPPKQTPPDPMPRPSILLELFSRLIRASGFCALPYLVQDHVAWFDGLPLHLFCDISILIIEADCA